MAFAFLDSFTLARDITMLARDMAISIRDPVHLAGFGLGISPKITADAV